MIGKVFLTSASIIVIATAAIADADESPSEAIERCAELEDGSARIACLEAALRGDTAPAEPSKTPAAPVISQAIEEVQKPLPEPVESASIAQPVELGAEQVEARTAVRATTPADNPRQVFAVSKTRTVPYEKLEITLANGQVWRQIKGDSQKIRVPRKYQNALTAEVWRGPVSGYKMRLSELKRTIRVERLK
ncbi:MAG: hypothetical protein ACX94B_06215 [Henriciella sp.]